MNEFERGIVRIKPVYVGIRDYRYVWGSVCSTDVVGTPPAPAPTDEQLQTSAEHMIQRFKDGASVKFLHVDEPFIIKEHDDLIKLSADLTYDVDALLVSGMGNNPSVQFTLAQYGLPIISVSIYGAGTVSDDFLRALRVKKFLGQSKFLYIGEIPSFSAPDGPYDFQGVEKRLGVRVQHIETNEFYRCFDRISEEEARADLNIWQKDFNKVIEPDEASLLDASRVYLALRQLCEKESPGYWTRASCAPARATLPPCCQP